MRPIGEPVPELKPFTVAAVVVAEVEARDETDARKIIVDAVKRELAMRGEFVREADGNVHLRIPDLPNWDDSVHFPVKIYSTISLREAIEQGWVNLIATIKRKVFRGGNWEVVGGFNAFTDNKVTFRRSEGEQQ